MRGSQKTESPHECDTRRRQREHQGALVCRSPEGNRGQTTISAPMYIGGLTPISRGAAMSMEDIVADRLGRVVADGFDIFKISKEALDIYQDPKLSLTKALDIALLSLMAMVEGPEFEVTEKEFYDFLSDTR